MAEIQPGSTGLSGEYFVAAELLRRGFSVGITMGNAKAIDILAEKGGKQYIIQVKAIFKKKNGGWPMMKSKIVKELFYVLVNLNGDIMAPPDYFIAKGAEIKGLIKQYETRGILSLSSVNNEKFKANWSKIR
jgi:hypothetical protein